MLKQRRGDQFPSSLNFTGAQGKNAFQVVKEEEGGEERQGGRGGGRRKYKRRMAPKFSFSSHPLPFQPETLHTCISNPQLLLVGQSEEEKGEEGGNEEEERTGTPFSSHLASILSEENDPGQKSSPFLSEEFQQFYMMKKGIQKEEDALRELTRIREEMERGSSLAKPPSQPQQQQKQKKKKKKKVQKKKVEKKKMTEKTDEKRKGEKKKASVLSSFACTLQGIQDADEVERETEHEQEEVILHHLPVTITTILSASGEQLRYQVHHSLTDTTLEATLPIDSMKEEVSNYIMEEYIPEHMLEQQVEEEELRQEREQALFEWENTENESILTWFSSPSILEAILTLHVSDRNNSNKEEEESSVLSDALTPDSLLVHMKLLPVAILNQSGG
jgi:hypothetical protein